jgi:hypothetical protein
MMASVRITFCRNDHFGATALQQLLMKIAPFGVFATAITCCWTSLSVILLAIGKSRNTLTAGQLQFDNLNAVDNERLAEVSAILVHAVSPPIAPANDNHAIH